jgi:hypothetical protein
MGSRYAVPVRPGVITRIVQILFLSFFFVYIELYTFYGTTLGTVRNVETGEIYPLNMHGHIVYLNPLQHRRLDLFFALGMFFGAIFGSIVLYGIYRQRKGDLPG